MKTEADWFPLCCVPSKRVAHELGLVVLACKSHYQVTPLENRRYLLEIAANRRELVQTQVSLYCEEVRRKKKGDGNSGFREPEYTVRILPFVLISCLLTVVFVWTSGEGKEWQEIGRMDSIAVCKHWEWWRLVTPLFLHGDIGHLIGNLGFGGLFAWFVIRRWGNLWGWIRILMSGVLGNMMLALTYQNVQHLSIGASTAVMGSIGLLAGASAWQRRQFQEKGIGWLGPIGVSLLAAAALFSLLGTAGENTDVAAHFWGWTAGIVIGYLSAND